MIAICPNPFRDINYSVSLQVQHMLEEAGHKTCICPIFVEEEEASLPLGLKAEKLSQVAAQCSLVIVLGGDGTVLAAARQLHDVEVPILGVDLGSKGFMTAVEPEELDSMLPAISGKLHFSRRMKLDVSVIRQDECIYSDNVLNDAVLHGYGDCIRMDIRCDGAKMTEIFGDGLVISTPTGSTGYSLSAGGPILEPDGENIVLSPICPHVLGARSFVLGPDREIWVRMEKLPARRAYLSLDGNSVLDLENGDIVLVKRSQHCTLMADVGLRSFYEITYKKLT